MKPSAKTIARARALTGAGIPRDVAVETAIREQVERARARPVRPSYSAFIQWMVDQDDTDWARHEEDDSLGSLSVTATMVSHLFEVDGEKVRADVRAGLRKAGRLP